MTEDQIKIFQQIAAKDHRYAKLLPDGVKPLPLVKKALPCVHLGPEVERQNCNCRRKDKRECLAGHGVVSQDNQCESCNDYKPLYSDCDAGVAIGHYNMPGLIELQIKVIRDTNGPATPIMVYDDHSPTDKIDFICKKYGVELFRNGNKRIGHAGGDLGAYFNGIQWAKRLGLRTLVKLSMRYVITRLGWLAEADDELHKQSGPILCDYCIEGPLTQPLRTEAIVFDVDKWFRQDILIRLRPRKISPIPAEVVVNNCLGLIDRNYNVWRLLGGPDRCRRVDGVIWHCANPDSDYRDLAIKYNVDLGEEFYSHPHPKQNQADWG